MSSDNLNGIDRLKRQPSQPTTSNGPIVAQTWQSLFFPQRGGLPLKNAFDAGFGQAQAFVIYKQSGLGQAQADIEATNSVFGQAQADVKAVGRGFGQAQAKITAVRVFGLANSTIDTGIHTSLDTFTRSVTGGLGTADIGGDWTLRQAPASTIDVNGSKAVVTLVYPQSQGAQLQRVTSGHQHEAIVKFNINSTDAPFQLNLFTHIHFSTNTARIIYADDNNSSLDVAVGGAASTAVGVSIHAGTDYWFKMHTLDNNRGSVALKAKVWPVGSPEPGWQIDTYLTPTIAVFGAGWPGFNIGPTSAGTIVATFDDWSSKDIGWTQSAQAQAKVNAFKVKGYGQAAALISTAVTTATDTFTRSLTDQWGTADVGGNWTVDVAADFDVNGTRGTIANADQNHYASLNSLYAPRNVQSQFDFALANLPAVGSYHVEYFTFVASRGLPNDGSNDVVQILVNSAGAVDVVIGGLSIPVLATYVAGDFWTVKIRYQQVNGIAIGWLKTWKVGTAEPEWQNSSDGNEIPEYPRGHIILGVSGIDNPTPTTTLSIDNLNVVEAFPVVHGQAQAKIAGAITAGYGQAQADIKQTYTQFGQAQADIKAVGNSFGQAQADIKAIGNGFGQANADIKAKGNALAQAQADILAKGNGFGQSQADIKATSTVFAQAQADIKATSYVFGQAQADIKAKGNAFAQAQADIKATSNVFGQAQADILAVSSKVAQAQADIKATSFGLGQAQAKINAFKVNGFGQAQADIKAISSVFAQAQATISRNTQGTAQAQADIKATSQKYAQAQADIKAISYVSAQAQADIRATYSQSANAQADIKAVGNSYGQSQARVKQTYSAFGQSQANVRATSNQYGQAQAHVKLTQFVFGQANAFVQKSAGYGQAQAQIGQFHLLQNLSISDRKSIIVSVNDKATVTLQEADTDSIILTLSDRSILLTLSDRASTTITLDDREY